METKKIKNIVFICIWSSLVILLKDYSFIDNHIGIGCIFLIMYFPAIQLFKISAKTHTILTLIFLLLTAFMAQIGFISEAEIFVIIAFGFLTIGIIQNLVKHFLSVIYEIN